MNLDNKIIKAGLGPEFIIKNEVFMESANTVTDDDENTTENSFADEPVDYTGYMKDAVLVGEYPFEVILEGLRNQFSNYISTEDTNDYVDIFYNEYHESIRLAEEQDFPDDIREALDTYLDKFHAHIKSLFYTKLAITIMDLEGEEIDMTSVETSIRELYTFFILNAKSNFMKVISKSSYKEIDPNLEDRAFYNRIREVLTAYSPIVLAVGPMEFLRYCEADTIYELFDTGRVVGNFLRRYSPRLYQNELFEAEIVAQITSIIDLHRDLKNKEVGNVQ